MRLARVKLYRYQLPLSQSLRLTNREGLIIRCDDRAGHQGYGEIAPFPGLHQETLEMAQEQILNLAPLLEGKEIPAVLIDLDGAFESWLKEAALFPSVRFGIESAVLNLLAEARHKPLHALLGAHYQQKVPINGLVIGTGKDSVRFARLLLEEGFATLKLKVGRNSLEKEIEMVRRIDKMLPSSGRLRLDANRAWQLNEAIHFARAVSSCQIEYIEEPLENYRQIPEFYKETQMNVALDESLCQFEPLGFEPFANSKVFVLKPSVLGGFEKTMQWIYTGKKHRIESVISCAFDSAISLATLVSFAASKIQTRRAMGLGTFHWFKADLIEGTIRTYNGALDVEEVFSMSRNIRMDLLKEIR